MVAPIIIRNPTMSLDILTAGTPAGAPVDVSDDVAVLELTPSVTTKDVKTFSGTYQSAGEPTWSGRIKIVVNEDTYSNWDALVGEQVRAKVLDRGADTARYRQFDTEILINPGIGGPTEPGSERSFDMVLPIIAAPTYIEP